MSETAPATASVPIPADAVDTNTDDLWAAASAAETPEKKQAIINRAEKSLTWAESELQKEGHPPARKRELHKHKDECHRVIRVTKKRLPHAVAETTGQRELREAAGVFQRTDASRRAFLLTEDYISTGEAIRTAAVVVPPPVPIPPLDSAERDRIREGRQLREGTAALRRAGFLRFLGEVTYRALPLDAFEKLPYQEEILFQTAEFATALPGWGSSDFATTALGEVTSLVDPLVGGTVDAAVLVVSAAATDAATPLGQLVERAGAEIEGRVVAAAAGAHHRAKELEEEFWLAETTEPDAVARAERAHRISARHPPTLLEALFLANRRAFTEAAGSPTTPVDLIFAEAVCQYTLLEVLSAAGILDMPRPSAADELARTLARRVTA